MAPASNKETLTTKTDPGARRLNENCFRTSIIMVKAYKDFIKRPIAQSSKRMFVKSILC